MKEVVTSSVQFYSN